MASQDPGLGLPQGVALAPDERVLASGSFMLNNLLFFIHWQMAVTNRRLVGRVPNTVFGIVPAGSTQVSYPLAAIAGVTSRTRYFAFWFLLGVLLVLIGFGTPNAVAVILGALALLASFRAGLVITNSGGKSIDHGVSFFDRTAASNFAQQVNSAIAVHAHQGSALGVASGSERPGPSASESLAELARLRDAGHVSSDEFEAKRREILGRL